MPQGTFGQDLQQLRASKKAQGPTLKDKTPTGIPGPTDTSGAEFADYTGLEFLKDLLTGVAKEGGDVAFNLGKGVHNTPVLGQLTDALAKLVGPEGTDPSAAFAQEPAELEATGRGGEQLGKGAGQLASFFLPVGPARAAAIKGLVKMIPNSASPAMMAQLNKLAALTGRIGGEAGSAAAVSAAHGDTTPGSAATAAATGTAAGEALGAGTTALRTGVGKKIAPIVAASLAMRGIQKKMPVGLGGSMGAFGLIKGLAHDFLTNPRYTTPMRRTLQAAGRGAGRVAANSATEEPPPRRRLP